MALKGTEEEKAAKEEKDKASKGIATALENTVIVQMSAG